MSNVPALLLKDLFYKKLNQDTCCIQKQDSF
jgi:hypothetical protein